MGFSYVKLVYSLAKLFLIAFVSIFAVIVLIYSFFDTSKLFTIPNDHPSAVVLLISLTAVLTGIMLQRQTPIEKNTLDFEEKYRQDEKTSNSFDLTLKICRENKEQIVDIAKASSSIGGKYDEQCKAIKHTLNQWERVANALDNNLYDENMLYRVYGGTVSYL